MVNVLEMPSDDVAIALGHTDGGELVRRLYGHRDHHRALTRILDAYESAANSGARDIQAESHPRRLRSSRRHRRSRPCSERLMSDTIARLDGPKVRFARSATRHRISKDSIRHVITNYRVRFEEPPQEGLGKRSIRIVYLGEDEDGQEVEVMAVELESGGLYVIHAMPLRKRYRTRYEEGR